jgi:hypothetical protein
MDNILAAVEYHKEHHQNAIDKTATSPKHAPQVGYAAEDGNPDDPRP